MTSLDVEFRHCARFNSRPFAYDQFTARLLNTFKHTAGVQFPIMILCCRHYQLRPQFLRRPLTLSLRGFIQHVPEPRCFLWVTEIRLLDLVGHDDDEAEIGAGDGVVEVRDLFAETQVL